MTAPTSRSRSRYPSSPMHAETPPTSLRLRLPSHVRACGIDDQVILLDLRRNRYLGVGGEHARAIATLVDDWPSGHRSMQTDPACSAAAALPVAMRLRAQGLITEGASEVRPRHTLAEATGSLDFEIAPPGSAISPRRVLRFAQQIALTSAWLRFRSLQSIAQAVTARRACSGRRAPRRGPDPSDALLACAAAYDRLRPFALTARDRCLHDSLTLVGFMASEGLFPQWVIGVRTRPFAAHSWVQSGGTVLNDQHDHVRRFSPILVV